MSAVAGTLKSTLAGMTGNITKACIQIYDQRPTSVTVVEAVAAGGKALPLASVANEVAAKAREMLGNGTSAAGTSTGSVRTFQVMFNPSTLHLSGYGFGDGQVTRTNFTATDKNKEQSVGMAPEDIRITLDVKLLFDRTDPSDSFLSDKLNLSTTALATNAVKTGMSLARKANHSVQQEVEAFTGALHSNRTRKMAFCWGKLRYDGYLERVNARYTMFNPLGIPTRAEVMLYMICADKDVAENNMGAWRTSYNRAFGSGNKSLVSTSQKVGSLLNFKL
ncbi:MAG: hypothetical protein LUC98_12030 [Lachnospiraceae bacterium]|nr:hypothetical protein [Lachnospiraceae bacterium]